MALAEHGAKFAKAKSLRQHMTHTQLHDFAATPRTGLPMRVKASKGPKIRKAGLRPPPRLPVYHAPNSFGALLQKRVK